MTDVLITADDTANVRNTGQGPFWLTDLVGYVFGMANDNGDVTISYWKTVDGGFTWSGPTAVSITTTTSEMPWCAYWDKQTKGNVGTKVHVAYGGALDGAPYHKTVRYVSLDTADDSVSSEVLIFDPQIDDHFGNDSGPAVSIIRSRAGSLWCWFVISNGRESGLYQSTDDGVTWVKRANPLLRVAGNTQTQYAHGILIPEADGADDDDIRFVQYDTENEALVLCEFDNSALVFELPGPSHDGSESNTGTVTLAEGQGHIAWSSILGWGPARYDAFRYENLPIAQGANIDDCLLEWSQSQSGTSGDNPDVDVFFDDADNSAALAATSNNISSRSLTTATVNYASANLGSTQMGQRFRITGLAALLQEVVDRGGWATGSAATLIVRGKTTNVRIFTPRMLQTNAGSGVEEQWSAFSATLHVSVDGSPIEAWTKTTIGVIDETNGYLPWHAIQRHSDGHILVAGWDTDRDVLKFWDITDSSTITAKTDVFSGASPAGDFADVFVDRAGGVNVAYREGSGLLRYKRSIDGGTTWLAARTIDTEGNSWGLNPIRSGGYNSAGIYRPIWMGFSIYVFVEQSGVVVGGSADVNADAIFEVDPVDCAFAGTQGAVNIRPRFTWRDQLNNEAGDLAGETCGEAIVGASVTFDPAREVTRNATFSINLDALGEAFQGVRAMRALPNRWIGVELLVEVDGEDVAYPFGLFRLSTEVEIVMLEGPHGTVQIKGYDPAILLTSTTEETYYVAAGVDYMDVVIQILDQFGLTRRTFTDNAKSVPEPGFSWPPGTMWITIINDLLTEGLNYWPLWFDGEGRAWMRYRGNPEDSEFSINVLYQDTEPAMIIPPFHVQQNWEREPNEIAAVIMDPAREQLYSVVRNNTVPPNGVTLLNDRVIRKQVAADRVADQDTLDSLAEWLLVEARSKTIQATLRTFPDPRRNPRQRLQEIYYVGLSEWLPAVDDEPTREYWLCAGWSLDLTKPGAVMEHKLQSIIPYAATVHVWVEEATGGLILGGSTESAPPPPPEDDFSMESTETVEYYTAQPVVWISNTIGYVFLRGGYQKTIDGGETWTTVLGLWSATVLYGVWYDKWTPGDTGTAIHVAWNPNDGTIHYRWLDTADDSLGDDIEAAFTDTPGGVAHLSYGQVCISKGEDGQLAIMYDVGYNTSASRGFATSTDDGESWSDEASPISTYSRDTYSLLPAAGSGFWLFRLNVAAGKIQRMDFDGSWVTHDIASGITYESVAPAPPHSPYQIKQFAAVVRHSDGKVLVAAWDKVNNSSANLKVWEVDGIAGVVAKGNVRTSSPASGAVDLFIDQNTDTIYVAYLRGTTWKSKLRPYWKKSADGGASWGSEQASNSNAFDGSTETVMYDVWLSPGVASGDAGLMVPIFSGPGHLRYLNPSRGETV